MNLDVIWCVTWEWPSVKWATWGPESDLNQFLGCNSEIVDGFSQNLVCALALAISRTEYQVGDIWMHSKCSCLVNCRVLLSLWHSWFDFQQPIQRKWAESWWHDTAQLSMSFPTSTNEAIFNIVTLNHSVLSCLQTHIHILLHQNIYTLEHLYNPSPFIIVGTIPCPLSGRNWESSNHGLITHCFTCALRK